MKKCRSKAPFIGAQLAIFKITPWWQRDGELTAVDLRDVSQLRVLAEKAWAVSEWKQIEALSRQVRLPNPEDQEFLEVSSSYGRIYFSIIQRIWTLQVLEYYNRDEGNKQTTRQSLKQYHLLWAEWQKLERDHSCCATPYITLSPQTYAPTWREHPDELINKALFNHGAGHTHDMPLVSRSRAAVA